eukprot:7003590-Pyramimonas_sp.AAC.1
MVDVELLSYVRFPGGADRGGGSTHILQQQFESHQHPSKTDYEDMPELLTDNDDDDEDFDEDFSDYPTSSFAQSQ